MLTAAAMPELMSSEPSGSMQARCLVQFVMDWNDRPEDRHAMIADTPSKENIPVHLASVASVVHALCRRDAVSIPEWCWEFRTSPEVTLSGIPVNWKFGEWVKSQSPQECHFHGVYFEKELLNS